MVLRDTVEVKGIPDPKIDGVTVYMSNVKDGRWKLKYLLSDPTSASISVNQTGSGWVERAQLVPPQHVSGMSSMAGYH